MRFDLITIFPEFFAGPLDYGIVRRAREANLIETQVHDLRSFTHDRHRTVDDRPFGGGEGMVMKPEPLFAAVESLIPPAEAPAPGAAAQPDLQAQVALLNKYLNDSGRPDEYRVDPASDSKLIQQINPATGAIIGEFSASEFPALARSVGVSGALIDSHA